MVTKFASVVLIVALVTTLGSASALARGLSDPEVSPEVPPTSSESGPMAKSESKASENLRAGVRKLVADAKAGKVAPAERLQLQPPASNGLSRRTKIAIGVGIGVVVLALIVVHSVNNIECKSRCVL